MNDILLISLIAGLGTAFIYAIQGIAEGIGAKFTRYYEIAFATQFVALVIMLAFIMITQFNVAISSKALVIAMLLGFVYSISLHFYFKALSIGPINIVSPVSNSYSIIAIPIAVLFLGEILTFVQYIGLAFVIFGVFIIDFKVNHRRINFESNKYLLYSLVTLVLWGVYMPIDSILIDNSNWITALFWELIFVNAFLFMLMARKSSIKGFKSSITKLVRPSLIIGTCEVAGGLLMNYGLEKGSVAILTPLITLSTVIVVLYSTVILKEKLHGRQAVGVACAIIGVFLLGA